MKRTYDKIDEQWLTRPTGDPFVDAGGYALEQVSELYPDEDILELIMTVTDIYVEHWGGKLNSFFLDSTITQPAFKGNRKKEETRKYYSSLLNDQDGRMGFCQITGRRTMVFPGGRNNMVLTGSNTFVNFHHNFQRGIMLSKEVLIRAFFLPLACMSLQGKLALISSNILEVSRFFSQKICKQNLMAVVQNSSESVLRAKSNDPSTALFRYADQVIEQKKREFGQVLCSLTLYHFSNFGASPELTVYQLPFQILKFYRFTQEGENKDCWDTFISRYYRRKGASYDEQEHGFQVKENRKISVATSEDFQYWQNSIYQNLLKGQSILPEMCQFAKGHELIFRIVRVYVLNILNMKKETVDKIVQMADFIISSNDDRGIGKVLKKLDGATNSYLLRRIILKDVVAKNYEEGNEDAIVSVRDYVDYLFPDIDSWKETRDVLEIALYEKLQEQHRKVAVESVENQIMEE
ncbi:type I-B CRISPR-associated protein Cas8b1/Cst1 [Prevotella cerevisiae]|jgi:CRISPR-associated protein Cst1|uniref:Type I-B CRISPR-associated protein Cas8b1/Cst1 n=1 Tax=Segatella cerevisiae TaxID=2053716 RepID=A0ABT1BTD2_9BACT|nr:type I-B CRISPR-associated protein Cas8b1/Cst1 [Segatella cerevisiae]MCO6024339.1 type I-B CRISPR-associated protein Cas8b1/Cst1 [Segatella cerevisiae]